MLWPLVLHTASDCGQSLLMSALGLQRTSEESLSNDVSNLRCRHRGSLSVLEPSDLLVLSINEPSITLLLNTMIVDRPDFMHAKLLQPRFPGLFGLENACFVSCFGLNSSSKLATVISSGLDTSIFFATVIPISASTPATKPPFVDAYTMRSLILEPEGHV